MFCHAQPGARGAPRSRFADFTAVLINAVLCVRWRLRRIRRGLMEDVNVYLRCCAIFAARKGLPAGCGLARRYHPEGVMMMVLDMSVRLQVLKRAGKLSGP